MQKTPRVSRIFLQTREAESGSDAAQDAASAVANNVPAKTYVLKYAELNPDGHLMDHCGDHFAELVKQ